MVQYTNSVFAREKFVQAKKEQRSSEQESRAQKRETPVRGEARVSALPERM